MDITRLKQESKNILIVFLVYFGLSTSCKSIKEKQQDQYTIVESLKGDCSIYKMVFKTGDCAFRFALSGKCEEITKDIYLNDYNVFLIENKNDIRVKDSKYIYIEYYKNMGIDALTIDEIIKTTVKIINRPIAINKTWDEGIVLELK